MAVANDALFSYLPRNKKLIKFAINCRSRFFFAIEYFLLANIAAILSVSSPPPLSLSLFLNLNLSVNGAVNDGYHLLIITALSIGLYDQMWMYRFSM